MWMKHPGHVAGHPDGFDQTVAAHAHPESGCAFRNFAWIGISTEIVLIVSLQIDVAVVIFLPCHLMKNNWNPALHQGILLCSLSVYILPLQKPGAQSHTGKAASLY